MTRFKFMSKLIFNSSIEGCLENLKCTKIEFSILF